MVADAVAFKLGSDETTNSFETRVVLAKSIPHDNALYLEINCEINPKEEGSFIEILRKIDDQYWESIMSIFELVPLDDEV